MPPPRAEIGQRWLIRNILGPGRNGWRIVVALGSDEHGRLYGVRTPEGEFPLTPVSGESDRGRYVRSRSLIRQDKRKRLTDTNIGIMPLKSTRGGEGGKRRLFPRLAISGAVS